MTAARDARPILVVDDEELNIRVIAAALRRAGYEAVCTRSPSEALERVFRDSPRLVLLDLNMPEMDGLTLLGKIRERSLVPIIMVTGVDRSDTAVRALRMGAYDYVTKPIDFRRLLDTIQLALGTECAEGQDRRIDHYEIVRELGRGGMGAVYEARDVTLDRRIALKVLLPELAADPFYELMFLREARAAAKVAHPSIVTVFEAGRYRGQLFLAMELVEGTTLSDLMEAGHAFRPQEAIAVGLQCAEALAAAHAAGLIHRDIKPANLMLTAEMKVKILDFGLARPVPVPGMETEASTFAGTIPYAAPEQIRNMPLDPRCDIFSLGVVLHELLADEHPFEDDTSSLTEANILAGLVRRPLFEVPGVPPNLAKLASRMIAVDRDRRPADMGEVASALRACLHGR